MDTYYQNVQFPFRFKLDHKLVFCLGGAHLMEENSFLQEIHIILLIVLIWNK